MTARALSGKVAIVTGSSQGLGGRIAEAYVDAGACVVLCARDEAPLERTRSSLLHRVSCPQGVEALTADVSDPAASRRVAELAITRFGRIDVLVNNAGIYGPMGRVEEVDWAEWIRGFEINVLGSVLMARAVLSTMRAQRKGKIIQLSGGGATKPMPGLSSYAASKAAVVRFAETLAEEVRGFGIDVNAIAPGALNTRLLDEVLTAGQQRVGDDLYEKSIRQKETGGDGLEAAASLAVFLASDVSDGITGKLISAVWDDWASWPAHLAELTASDAYTLRRLTGRERGLSWGDK